MLKVLKEELGMEGNRERNVKVLEMVKLTKSTKGRGRERRRPPVAVAVKQFLLVALGLLLVPTSSRIYTFFCSYWFEPRVDNLCLAVPKAKLYGVAPVLLSREEVRSRFFPGHGRREWESGTSSSALHTASPWLYTTEWWEETDLESLDTDEIKVLQCLTEKVMHKWDSWRESVRRVAIKRQQDKN
ncbi:unnamed protein product [Linum trigynum]|uniref:Uncharacterized protein n=1 Tax=Linum trigynum TaxID=586398 RepID=A0AAV2CXI2_9ROSI